MITIDEYLGFLEQQKEIFDYYNGLFEEQAENSKYQRKQCQRKYLKDIERRRAIGLNIYDILFKKALKTKDVAIVVKKDNSKIKTFFKKLFHIKNKEIPIMIENKSKLDITTENKKEDVEAESEKISSASLEDIGLEEVDDLDFEDFDEESDNIIKGQMDITELNEGEVYEEEC